MMTLELLRATAEPAKLCGEAAGICTACDDCGRALRGALASGHESVIEHAVFTFRVTGVSRVRLAQLTRHRLASFSVQSQRYTGVNTEDIVRPASFAAHHYVGSVDALLWQAWELYKAMVADGIPPEDARYIIPQGVTCNLIVTMNARELLHFFSLRCCNRAQGEIRELADNMLGLCREAAPELFRRAGCACMQNLPCPEGKRSCGHPRAVHKGG